MDELINSALIEQIKALLEASRQKIAIEVNTTLLHTYWQIGKIIIEDMDKTKNHFRSYIWISFRTEQRLWDMQR